MRNFAAIIISVLYLFVQTGCASIISGKTQDVEILSNPPGATVLVDGMMAGYTPMTKEFKRKKRHEVVLKKEGYIDETRMTKRGYNWWNMGNILIGGIIGIIIDFATGAVYSVEPETIHIQMLEGQSTLEFAQGSGGEVRVAKGSAMEDINSIEKLGELKDKGLITDEEFAKKKAEILNL